MSSSLISFLPCKSGSSKGCFRKLFFLLRSERVEGAKGTNTSFVNHPQYPWLRACPAAKKLTRNGDPYPFYDDGAIREGEGTFLSNTQKIYMAEWHAVASLVFGITIPFIVVEWSEPKAKKSAYSC